MGEYLPNWHPWEDYRKGYSARKDLGGGVVLTLCHPLDYARWLFGEVAALWAFTGRQSDLTMDVEDTAEIGLRFENGLLGNIHLDYVQRPPKHQVEIICAGGTIKWDDAPGDVEVFDAQKGEWLRYPLVDGFERNDLFVAEMKHFLNIINNDAEPICSLDDGIWALKLALGVHESANDRRLVTW